MPIPGGGRYRMLPNGVRLHFDAHGNVNEAKNMETGKVHTPAEFKADKKKKGMSDKEMSAHMNKMIRGAK